MSIKSRQAHTKPRGLILQSVNKKVHLPCHWISTSLQIQGELQIGSQLSFNEAPSTINLVDKLDRSGVQYCATNNQLVWNFPIKNSSVVFGNADFPLISIQAVKGYWIPLISYMRPDSGFVYQTVILIPLEDHKPGRKLFAVFKISASAMPQ